MHIPIKPMNYFHENYPDIAFLFAWNHKKEIFEKDVKPYIKGSLNFTPNNQSFISKKPTTLDRADSKSASDIANNKSVSDLVKSFMRPTPIISP